MPFFFLNILFGECTLSCPYLTKFFFNNLQMQINPTLSAVEAFVEKMVEKNCENFCALCCPYYVVKGTCGFFMLMPGLAEFPSE